MIAAFYFGAAEVSLKQFQNRLLSKSFVPDWDGGVSV
jgi:hypothetical protein